LTGPLDDGHPHKDHGGIAGDILVESGLCDPGRKVSGFYELQRKVFDLEPVDPGRKSPCLVYDEIGVYGVKGPGGWSRAKPGRRGFDRDPLGGPEEIGQFLKIQGILAVVAG
jgi:hypothetical protein